MKVVSRSAAVTISSRASSMAFVSAIINSACSRYCRAVSLGSCWLKPGVKNAEKKVEKSSTLRIQVINQKILLFEVSLKYIPNIATRYEKPRNLTHYIGP